MIYTVDQFYKYVVENGGKGYGFALDMGHGEPKRIEQYLKSSIPLSLFKRVTMGDGESHIYIPDLDNPDELEHIMQVSFQHLGGAYKGPLVYAKLHRMMDPSVTHDGPIVYIHPLSVTLTFDNTIVQWYEDKDGSLTNNVYILEDGQAKAIAKARWAEEHVRKLIPDLFFHPLDLFKTPQTIGSPHYDSLIEPYMPYAGNNVFYTRDQEKYFLIKLENTWIRVDRSQLFDHASGVWLDELNLMKNIGVI